MIITDEEDDHDVPANSYPGSPGDPSDWFEAVVAAKDGEASRAVVMAVVQPPQPNACSDEQNSESIVVWAQGDRIIEFSQKFEHHVVADICESDYAAPFQAFLDSISKGCEEFIPPK